MAEELSVVSREDSETRGEGTRREGDTGSGKQEDTGTGRMRNTGSEIPTGYRIAELRVFDVPGAETTNWPNVDS